MNREKTFYNLYNAIHLENTADYDSAIKNITKKLNESYYEDSIDTFDVEVEHSMIVGSIGRGTAIKHVSDVDMLFILPDSVYDRFNNYSSNGQSSLLQDVKSYLIKRYPRTEIKGDGQAVVIEFEKFSIDLVPVFKENNESFKYADSNDGGKWKNTNPIPEQNKSKEINITTNNNFIQLCNLIRLWKDSNGFVFGGLFIDSLVYSFFSSNEQFYNYTFNDYHELIIAFLEFLSKIDKNTIHYALGSRQQIIDKGKGAFIDNAKEILKKFAETGNIELKIENVYCAMFGNKFSESLVDGKRSVVLLDAHRRYNYINTEEFIENLFPVNIKYKLKIDCKVTANGFRPKFLSSMFSWLPIKRNLEFFIKECDVPEPYSIYWKVRNTGDEAYKRDMVRGQILEGTFSKIERTDFSGNHYVECYIIKGNICVARHRLPVRINAQLIE